MNSLKPPVSAEPDSEQVEENVPRKIPVLLADSQVIYRVGMRKIFAAEHDLQVVSEVDSVVGVYSAAARFPTAVLIIEGNLLSGTTDAIPELLRHAPGVQIIIQSTASDESNTVELYRQGVRGVTFRSISPATLLQCVRKIAGGEIWIDDQSVNWLLDAYRSQRAIPSTQPSLLTPKELAIITCVTQAMKNKAIAQQLGTSEQVIKNNLCKVYGKLGVSDRLELALYCGNHDVRDQSFGGANEASNFYASKKVGNGKANGHVASFVMAPKT